ncbi:MAG TPA: hypothetical protein VFP59_00495 [Candidatus Angelobacter sp.]|nr:hypothetical protein [Candidatus Angelobacter sp.]
MSLFAVWVPIITFIVIGLYLVVQRQFRLHDDRTIDEVTVFLRRVDWDEAQNLFDPASERYSRLVQSDYHFRRTMRVRIHAAREFVWRMYHNVRLVHEWANTELRDLLDKSIDDCSDREKLIMALAEQASYFRALALMRLFELTMWTAFRVERWPFMYIPSVAAMRKCGQQNELDFLELYDQLKNAAAGLALNYGKDFYDEMLALF